MDMSLSKLQELVLDREPDVLQSIGWQRVGHDWVTEMKWAKFRNISTKQSSHILDTKLPAPFTHKVNVLYWNLEESSENASIYLYICLI